MLAIRQPAAMPGVPAVARSELCCAARCQPALSVLTCQPGAGRSCEQHATKTCAQLRSQRIAVSDGCGSMAARQLHLRVRQAWPRQRWSLCTPRLVIVLPCKCRPLRSTSLWGRSMPAQRRRASARRAGSCTSSWSSTLGTGGASGTRACAAPLLPGCERAAAAACPAAHATGRATTGAPG